LSAFLADSDFRWSRPLPRKVFAAVTRMGYAAADLVVTTSRGVAEDLIQSFGVYPDRLRVVPNPIDLETISRSSLEPLEGGHASLWKAPVMVAAGRLAEVKNYPLLIEAVSLLRRRIPVNVFILGQGEQESALRLLIEAKGLSAAVHLCGFQANPWKYM